MKNTSILIATLILSLFSNVTYAQEPSNVPDEIHKVTGDVIEARVTEMNTTEVKYYYLDRPGVVLAIENELVDYIILSTGEKVVPKNNDETIANLAYEKQKKMAIKLGLFTPLQGYTDLGFEYSHKPLQSIEGTLGIIGLGNNDLIFNNTTDRGVSLSTGYKVYAGPDFHLRKMRNAHRMQGLYVKPTIALAYFNSSYTGEAYNWQTGENINFTQEDDVTQAAFLLQLGRQYILGDIISIDFNLGLGYGFKSINTVSSLPSEVEYTDFWFIDRENNYAFSTFQDGGIAFNSAFKIGVLLK